MKKILLLSIVIVLTLTTQAQTSVTQTSEKQEIGVYPNPAQSEGIINVVATNGFIPQSALLSTSSGKPLVVSNNVTARTTLALPKLSSGTYFLTFFDKYRNKKTKKLVVTY